MTLYDRGPEVDTVVDAMRVAEHGRGQLVVVSGPAGIGKSKFLQHLPVLADERGVLVLQAGCAPLEQDFAFGVVRQLLEASFIAADGDVRERWLGNAASQTSLLFTADLMRSSGGRDEELMPDEDRRVRSAEHPVLHGLVRMISAMSADQPLLLLVDDVQWADMPSLRMLGYLARRMADPRVTVVMAIREGDPRADRLAVRELVAVATHRLWLGPLAADSVQRMVRDEFGEAGDEEFVVACHEVGMGNPMFLTSMIAFLRRSGYRPLATSAGMVTSLSPPHLRDRVAGYLRVQPHPITAFAKAMVVLDRQGDSALVGRLADLDPVGRAEAVRQLGRLGLIVRGEPPRFVHAVIRGAVEQMMTAGEVDRLHRRAAGLLYDSGHSSEDVVVHLLATAGECEPWAIEVLRESAATAFHRGTPEMGARYLHRALMDSSPGTADRATLLVELAAVEVEFDPAAALRHLSQGVPSLPSTRDRAVALAQVPPALLATASQMVVEIYARVADEMAQEAAESVRVSAFDREIALCLEARLRFTRFRQAGQLADAVERLRGLGPDVPLNTKGDRELAEVLLYAATMTGSYPAADALRLGRKLLDLEPASSRTAHAVVPLVIGALIAAGSPESAQDWLKLALDEAVRVGSAAAQTAIGAEYALVLLRTGDLAEAKTMASMAVESVGSDRAKPASRSVLVLALVAIEVDDVVLAEWVLARCGGVEPSVSESWLVGLIRAWLAARSGDQVAALDHLMDCGRSLDLLGWRNPAAIPWRGWAAGLNYSLGKQGEALELADEEYGRALEWGAPDTVGRALRIRGMITEGDAGVELLIRASAILAASGDALELARVTSALDHRRGTASRKGHPVQAGVDVWFGLGKPVSAALTKTERRVSARAAEGFTNHEIAEEFGVTSRAVEKHLTSSYRKLGVAGRAGLPAALADLE